MRARGAPGFQTPSCATKVLGYSDWIRSGAVDERRGELDEPLEKLAFREIRRPHPRRLPELVRQEPVALLVRSEPSLECPPALGFRKRAIGLEPAALENRLVARSHGAPALGRRRPGAATEARRELTERAARLEALVVRMPVLHCALAEAEAQPDRASGDECGEVDEAGGDVPERD